MELNTRIEMAMWHMKLIKAALPKFGLVLRFTDRALYT